MGFYNLHVCCVGVMWDVAVSMWAIAGEDRECRKGTKIVNQDWERRQGTKIGNEDGEPAQGTKNGNQDREPTQGIKTMDGE